MTHWHNKHIEEQAAHYGLTVEQKAKLFNGAGEYDELIIIGDVDEPTQEQKGVLNE